MSQKLKAWVILRPDGTPLQWGGAYYCRSNALEAACEGLLPATDYWDLKTDSLRWKKLRRQGFRIVRATVEIDADA